MIDNNNDTDWESLTGTEVEDALIATYVPESATMSRADALALALQRDEEYAEAFTDDIDDEDLEILQDMRSEMSLDYENKWEEDEDGEQ